MAGRCGRVVVKRMEIFFCGDCHRLAKLRLGGLDMRHKIVAGPDESESGAGRDFRFGCSRARRPDSNAHQTLASAVTPQIASQRGEA